jgi:hypothetical protein
MAIGVGLWYIVFQALLLWFPARTGRVTFVSDVPGKIAWFVNEPLSRTLNFYNLDAKRWIAFIMLGIITVGLWFYFKATPRRRLLLVVIALALLPVSFAINLVAAEDNGSYRTLTAISALCLVYLFLALRGIGERVGLFGERAVNALAVAITTLGVLAAFYTVTVYTALPGNALLVHMRQQFASQFNAQAQQVIFFQPSCRQTLAPRIFSEFGGNSACRNWVPANATYLILYEIDPSMANLPVTIVPPSGSLVPPEHSIVIDMRNPP